MIQLRHGSVRSRQHQSRSTVGGTSANSSGLFIVDHSRKRATRLVQRIGYPQLPLHQACVRGALSLHVPACHRRRMPGRKDEVRSASAPSRARIDSVLPTLPAAG